MRISLLIFLLCTPVYAVVVKDCPKNIELNFSLMELDEYQTDQLDRNNCWYDCHNDRGIVEAQNTLKEFPYLGLKLSLQSARSAVCEYKGELENLSVYAKIEGSFRDGAASKARLTTYWNSLVIYTRLGSMKPDSIEPLSSFSSLYYNGESCHWGDCLPNHISVGSARSTELRVIE